MAKDEKFLEWKRSVLPRNVPMFGRLTEARWKEKPDGEFGDDSFLRYADGLADDEKTYLGAVETVRKIRDEFIRWGETLPDWTEPPSRRTEMTEPKEEE
jgi:hypothetical protein